MIKEYIVIAKTTYQVAEDKWQYATLTAAFNCNTTIEQIFNWAKKEKADLNTIELHENQKEEK